MQNFLSYYPCCKHNKGCPCIVSFYFDILCCDLWLNLFDHDLCGSEIIKGRSLKILPISRHDEYKWIHIFADDISIVQDEEASKLATIDEDSIETTVAKAASKSSKFNLAKAILKGDKSKPKEAKRDAVDHKTSLTNGDAPDAVHVTVGKNNSRIVVDNIEMQAYNRKNVEMDHSEEKSVAVPLIPKPRSSASIGKDIKVKLQEHQRNPSGSSVNSDNYSTNL